MDKPISELIEALSVLDDDLYVLEQGGEAKKLKWAMFIKFAAARLDGHGGIQSIALTGTSGLIDTYTITMSDGKTYDIAVKNGRGISEISKTSTSGLVDTYTISYNNGTTSTLTVTNGEKGDKGDNAYVWIKYASQEPTESSHSIGDLPDDWIGIYFGKASTAPTDWKQYQWFKHKGEHGDTGAPATLVSTEIVYQSSDSGTIIPSGAWGSSIPVVSQGKYLWTKTEVRFNTGDPIVSYSVARMGIDGTGSVSSVAGVSPDPTGNVTLAAADVGALPVSGGDMTGPIRMNGQPISGLNDPTDATQAARKGYVDLAAYPVGAIYLSAAATSPASLFGGTWEQLKGRFLLGAGDTYAAGATGGEAAVTLALEEIPPHSHNVPVQIYDNSPGYVTLSANAKGASNVFSTGNTGGGASHNNMPPYLVVYMWKRVA